MGPSAAADPEMRQWLGRYQRLSASPGRSGRDDPLGSEHRRARRAGRGQSPPTLVLTRADDQFLRSGHGRYLAEHIPGESFRSSCRGGTTSTSSAMPTLLLDEVQEFLTGVREACPSPIACSRR